MKASSVSPPSSSPPHSGLHSVASSGSLLQQGLRKLSFPRVASNGFFARLLGKEAVSRYHMILTMFEDVVRSCEWLFAILCEHFQ